MLLAYVIGRLSWRGFHSGNLHFAARGHRKNWRGCARGVFHDMALLHSIKEMTRDFYLHRRCSADGDTHHLSSEEHDAEKR